MSKRKKLDNGSSQKNLDGWVDETPTKKSSKKVNPKVDFESQEKEISIDIDLSESEVEDEFTEEIRSEVQKWMIENGKDIIIQWCKDETLAGLNGVISKETCSSEKDSESSLKAACFSSFKIPAKLSNAKSPQVIFKCPEPKETKKK